MEREKISDTLFNKTDIVAPYPHSVKPVEKVMNLTAFFPGGSGLWLEEGSTEIPSILVLGQDFSTVNDYNRMLRNEIKDLACATWRNLIVLFKEANIDLNECFFSNVFMGLRDTNDIMGEFPGFKDKDFVKRNLMFLEIQIETIKPRLIITLGKYAAEMVSRLSDSGLERWLKWKALREPDIGFVRNVNFKEHRCSCVALEHTSMRNSNVKRRKYANMSGELTGNSAEVQMLKDALGTNNMTEIHKLNHTGTITLETEKLILRRFTIDDTEAVYNNWTSDSEVSKYMRWEPHKNINETRLKINDWLERYHKNNFYQWVITIKDSGEPIGAIGLFVVNEGDLCGDFGYSISRKYWGQGIATEALKAVIKFAFEEVGFNRIESYHSTKNPASGKVMLNAGMKFEGLAKQKYRSNVGFEDCNMYSILKDDYDILD
jgi:ribosomal-protein-alanine N-acetyltransferase